MAQSGFDRLADAVRDAWWSMCDFKNALLDATGDPQIAWVIFGRCENQSLEWLSKPVSAFDGKTPASLLESEDGREQLRALLMQMP